MLNDVEGLKGPGFASFGARACQSACNRARQSHPYTPNPKRGNVVCVSGMIVFSLQPFLSFVPKPQPLGHGTLGGFVLRPTSNKKGPARIVRQLSGPSWDLHSNLNGGAVSVLLT